MYIQYTKYIYSKLVYYIYEDTSYDIYHTVAKVSIIGTVHLVVHNGNFTCLLSSSGQ